MKAQRWLLALLALTFAFAPQSPTASAARRREYGAKLVSPKPGDVLIPGQVVKVEWTATYPDVDLSMCETEVLLSIDGGRTYSYITGVWNPQVHYFNWTVPKSPTNEAVLDIRFGCLNIYPETASPQVQSKFVISSMN